MQFDRHQHSSRTLNRRGLGLAVAGTSLVGSIAVLAVSFGPGAQAAATEVDLGKAGQYAVLGGAGVTNTGPTTIQTEDASVRGDVGTYPLDTITGDASISWIPPATGSLHKGDDHAKDAQADNLIAYNSAAGAASAETIGGQLDGMEFKAGVRTASSALNLAVNGTVTFNAEGDPDAEFIVQVGSSLTMEVGSTVALTNGAQACHIFWQVSEDATIKSNADFVGTVLAENAIVAQSGADIEGRLLAQNASVTLDNNTFTMPGCSARETPTTPTVTPPPGSGTDGGDADSDAGDIDDEDADADADGGNAEGDADSTTPDGSAGDADSSDGAGGDEDVPLPDTGGPPVLLLLGGTATAALGAGLVLHARRRV